MSASEAIIVTLESDARLLTTDLSLSAGLLQVLIPRGVDFLLPSRQHVLGRHVSDCAVQPHGVVVIHVGLNQG